MIELKTTDGDTTFNILITLEKSSNIFMRKIPR